MTDSDSNPLYHRGEGDPVRLRRDQSGWRINFGIEARTAGIEAGDYVVVDLEDPGTDPLLLLGLLPEAPENPKQDPFTRKVMDRGDTLAVKIPPRYIDERGLDLDADTYDNDNPLLLEPLVDDGLVGLEPTEYYDGTEFVPSANRDDSGVEVTPDAEVSEHVSLSENAPNTPESVGAIPADAITAAAQLTGVETEAVERALTLVSDGLDADALADYSAPEHDPVETPEGTVTVVTPDVWGNLDATQGLGPNVQQAVRQAHARAAERLLDVYAPDSAARGFAGEYDAVVTSDQ